jgi:hypothetical protein
MSKDQTDLHLEAGAEQIRYAGILEKGMLIGLVMLLATFAVYALGILEPYIPRPEISNYWGMSVHQYLEEAHVPVGWGWVKMLGYSDFLNFTGIAVLAGVTGICFLSIIPLLLKNKDKVYAGMAFLEAVILGLAASGILAVGH